MAFSSPFFPAKPALIFTACLLTLGLPGLFAVKTVQAQALPALGADSNQLTVSGISSGGYMAMQYHFAHASEVAGAGIIAAGPYECAEDSEIYPGFFSMKIYPHCMESDSDHPPPSKAVSIAHVMENVDAGLIDSPVQGMANDRVWLFTGGNDHTVTTPVVTALRALYEEWAGAVTLLSVDDAGHTMVTGDAIEANACSVSEPPYISHCDGIDAPELMLTYLYHPQALAPKAAPGSGELVRFDQAEFKQASDAWGLGDAGYIFIPSGCREGGCRVHIAFHGCLQSVDNDDTGTLFVEHAGYNRWAESNRIIVLYPQTHPVFFYAWSGEPPWFVEWMQNPNACWDWWGYDSENYATKEGEQIQAVHLMVARLLAPIED